MTKKSMLEYGQDDELDVATRLNEYFTSKKLTLRATDDGGSGHGNDIIIQCTQTGNIVSSIECKNSSGTRTDYGQFQVRYDPRTGWQYHATSKSTPVTGHVFEIIKPQMDALVHGNFPAGPTMTLPETKTFWNAYEPNRTRSLISGNVVKIPIPNNVIPDYYFQKGNEYIKIEEDMYALKPGTIPTLESRTKECYAQFRIKDHGRRRTKDKVPIDGTNKQSYTVALRLKCESHEDTEFYTVLNQVYTSS